MAARGPLLLSRFAFFGLCLILFLFAVSCSRLAPAIQDARNLEQQQRWAEALSAYNRTLPRIKPSHTGQIAGIYSHIGHCLIELGRGTDALAALQQALSLDAGNREGHLRMAQLLILADEPQRAEPHIDMIVGEHPDDPEMLQVRASMYASEEHLDLAERDLLRAYAQPGDRDQIAERLGQLYISSDKIDKARAILTSAAPQSKHKSGLLLALARLEETEGASAAAESDYRQAVAAENTEENNERLAQFLARSGRVEEAANILRTLDASGTQGGSAIGDLEMQTGHPQQALLDYQAAYNRISSDVNSGKAQEGVSSSARSATQALAIRIIEAALALASSGDNSALYAARNHLALTAPILDSSTRDLLAAEIELASGNIPGAKAHAEASLSTGRNAPADYLLGVISSHSGEHEGALKHWSAALEANEAYPPARLALAGAAIDRGDGVKAEDYAIDVVREEPANIHALLLYARAMLLEHRYDAARSLCQRMASANSSDSQPSIVLGDIYLAQHQLALALLEYEKAMLLEPHSKQAIEGLTTVYQRGGANLAMLRKLERLSQSGTPSSRLMEITGRLYASQHMYADATRCLQRAVEMDPGRESATLALAGVYAENKTAINGKDLLSKPGMQLLPQLTASPDSLLLAALRMDRAGDQSAAIHAYEATVRGGDPTGIASNNLAWLYVMRGTNLKRALELAQRALQVNPGSPQVLDTLGVIQMKNRQFTKAISSFQSGRRRASRSVEAADLQHTIEAHLNIARQLAGQPVSHR